MPRKASNASTGSDVKTINKKPPIKIEMKAADETATAPVKSVETVDHKNDAAKPAFKVKELDPHSYVTVRNGFNGKLVYVSKRNGERIIWDEFGAEQELELQELKIAKNSSRAFFQNNWFMIDDPDVIAYLGVERFYKNSLSIDEFDELFGESPDVICERIAVLPEGQKSTVAFRARQLIASGDIDSIRVINALEKSLGVELIER